MPVSIPDFSGLRVHVIGDAIRDVYTQAKCLGAASKSPTLVYEKGESEEWIGGAGVVAHHCRAAGAAVALTCGGITVKERILVEGVKVCEFHEHPSNGYVGSAPTTWGVDGSIHVLPNPDVVIFADFGHGIFKPGKPLMELYPGGIHAADSQTTDISWGNILDFAGCDLLFANEREARFAMRDQQNDRETVCDHLWDAATDRGTKALFVKLGADGLRLYAGSRDIDRVWNMPAFATQPIVDPIGAGDALLAYATLTYAVTKDLEQAGIIGSLAAAEACAHMGNVPVTLEAVKARAGALA